ncbi:Set1/Ash2 histone methyltransferase complex subunit ASH2 [Halocaridina rubra]|uniref:Set1/Ash2 histone methyltransferase complex subunit ASH2 n=1 Tax=Halocaridina rubra TaxID=373956 RepID=A0AAN8XKG9_HALRR
MDYDSDENDNLDTGVVDIGEKGGLSSCGYCGKLRNLNIVELMCWQCGSWFHESCISYQFGKLVPFMLCYSFTCKNCSTTGVELFRKTQAQLRDMCITALANLQNNSKDKDGRHLFSLQRDIIPFLEQHWDALTTAARRTTQSWHATLQRMLMKEVDTYFTVEETGDNGEPGPHHPFFGLLTSDLTLIRPIVDAPGGWRSPLSSSSTYSFSPTLSDLAWKANLYSPKAYFKMIFQLQGSTPDPL